MKRTGGESTGETLAQFPIQVRSTEYTEGETLEARTVRCAVSKGSETLEHCMNCKRFEGMVSRPEGESSLWCRVPVAALEGEAAPGELGRKLETTPVSEVMTANVICVDSELNMDELARLFEKKHIRAAPVVEDEGVLVGMVSKSDLVRGCAHDDEEDELDRDAHFPPNCLGVIVDSIMTTDVAKLLETASLAEAARVFSTRGVHHLPVVTKDDVVVGMLSVMDLVRWLAGASQPRSLPSGTSGS
jgi:CBS domain-containing protein